MPDCKRVHVGVAAVIIRYNEIADEFLVLMGLRCGKHGPGTWSLPGGWVEHGEEPKQSVIREIAEETGIIIDPDNNGLRAYDPVPYTNTIFDSGVQSLTLFFIVSWDKEDHEEPRVLEPDKCSEWKWVPLSEMNKLKLFDPIIGSSIVESLQNDELDGTLY